MDEIIVLSLINEIVSHLKTLGTPKNEICTPINGIVRRIIHIVRLITNCCKLYVVCPHSTLIRTSEDRNVNYLATY